MSLTSNLRLYCLYCRRPQSTRVVVAHVYRPWPHPALAPPPSPLLPLPAPPDRTEANVQLQTDTTHFLTRSGELVKIVVSISASQTPEVVWYDPAGEEIVNQGQLVCLRWSEPTVCVESTGHKNRARYNAGRILAVIAAVIPVLLF